MYIFYVCSLYVWQVCLCDMGVLEVYKLLIYCVYCGIYVHDMLIYYTYKWATCHKYMGMCNEVPMYMLVTCTYDAHLFICVVLIWSTVYM